MPQYKFVHIMAFGWLHYRPVIRMFEENPEFNAQEHLFVVSSEQFRAESDKARNVVVEPDIISSDMRVFNRYVEMSEITFLHCNNLTTSQFFKVNRRNVRRIVWCVFGMDLYGRSPRPVRGERGFLKKVRIVLRNAGVLVDGMLWAYKAKQLRAIGVGFAYDSIQVRRRFGANIPLLSAPYGYRRDNLQLLEANSLEALGTAARPLKILVGHSGYAMLNHARVLHALEKFKDEDIVVSLVLSYGVHEYIEEVITLARGIFGSKVEVIGEQLPYEEYVEFLREVDIAVFDYSTQSALGNVYLLLSLGKTLYLHETGVVKSGLLVEGVATRNASDISRMTFEEFASPIESLQLGRQFGRRMLDGSAIVAKWNSSIAELARSGAR